MSLSDKKLYTNSNLLSIKWRKNYSKVVYNRDDVRNFIYDLKNEIDELGDYAKADVVSLALIKTIKGVIDNFAGDRLIWN